MKKGLVDRKTVLRLLQAQECTGGIVDPILSVFIPKDIALKHNLLDENLFQALNQNPQCYLDPESEQDASYGALMKRCQRESHTGLLLLPITEKLDPSKLLFNVEAKKKKIMSCDIQEACAKGVVDKDDEERLDTAVRMLQAQESVGGILDPVLSVYLPKDMHISSVSITLASPVETVGEQDPVGAIFDTETLEKISILEALNRGLVDSITAQRLLEAQACTGGIVNPINGHRLSIQEASRQGVIDEDMATKLKPAQKAYIGFTDVKNRKKLSAAQAMKEMWLPYEAGQRFMEFQVLTGGLYDPELGCRRTIEDALKIGWLDGRSAQKLQDTRHHTKILTCPKSKLRISYKEAMDNCLVEENTGVKMLPASTVSSRGISSPYNVSSAPGSRTGSRSGSRRGSRRSSIDLGSPYSSLTSRHLSTSYSHSYSSKSTC
uniref:Uncharacterized protein n=1 Tax=Myripristis murdjan TaxID=586833 RepID=A0A667Z2G9_9TELE